MNDLVSKRSVIVAAALTRWLVAWKLDYPRDFFVATPLGLD
jgi:hypothetical protein